jgi:septum formation protein
MVVSLKQVVYNRAMAKLILASQSPQRAKLLATLGIDFSIMPSEFDEAQAAEKDPQKRAEFLARAKVLKVAEQHPDAVILGADTYVWLDTSILEKPKTVTEAKAMLRQQAGKTITAVCGTALYTPQTQEKVFSTTVMMQATFRSLTEAEIEYYVSNNPVTTWAGGFSAFYPEGFALFSEVHGSLTALIGLPLEVVIPWLRESGVLI